MKREEYLRRIQEDLGVSQYPSGNGEKMSDAWLAEIHVKQCG